MLLYDQFLHVVVTQYLLVLLYYWYHDTWLDTWHVSCIALHDTHVTWTRRNSVWC